MKTLSQVTQPSEVLFWNVWGCRYPAQLNEYLKNAFTKGLDIALLTEVTDVQSKFEKSPIYTSTRVNEPPSYPDGWRRIKQGLPEHVQLRYDTPRRDMWQCARDKTNCAAAVGFGSALLFNSQTLEYQSSGANPILQDNQWDLPARILQWVVFVRGNVRYLVAHLHGVWIEGNTKGNHPARTLQSLQITHELACLKHEYNADKVIFGGDLNLDINTEALNKLIGGNSVSPNLRLRNLIAEFGISNTRTKRYHRYNDGSASVYADYVLVGPNVCVDDFTVSTNMYSSDHAPLRLVFS